MGAPVGYEGLLSCLQARHIHGNMRALERIKESIHGEFLIDGVPLTPNYDLMPSETTNVWDASGNITKSTMIVDVRGNSVTVVSDYTYVGETLTKEEVTYGDMLLDADARKITRAYTYDADGNVTKVTTTIEKGALAPLT